MNKVWSIFKYEFYKTVSRRSFILTLILVPLVPALILWVLNSLSASQSQALGEVFTGGAQQAFPYGVVDQSGLVKEMPDWIVGNSLVLISDETTARQQTLDGKLQGYYVVTADYLESGEVILYKEEINPLAGIEGTAIFEQLMQYNLLGGDMDLYLKYTQSPSIQMVEINPQTADARDTDNPLTFLVPYAITLFFYTIIFTSSSMLLTAISKEKENRVMEMLLSSVKPTQLFTGKLMGLGLANLLQMAIWFGAALLLLRLSGQTFAIPANLQIPAYVFLYGIVFFALGFAFYGSLMAGWGAMVPNLREGNQSTFVFSLPLLFTIISISTLINEPHGTLSTVLSILPPTAPVAMMTRLAIGGVPLWQVGVALALLVLSDLFLIRSVAKIFKSQYLLSGSAASINTFFKVLFQRQASG
ncbi:MAG: Molybdenum ABC transporter permease protein [Anaerolineae bacterium 49_20]|nr:MAG: Molybdenum ABC transporter permease protein [Anaerolineae bacterium 49_20]